MESVTSPTQASSDDQDYQSLQGFLTGIGSRLTGPLFTTDVTGLFDVFLAALPAAIRQHYNCIACRRFVDRFGGLVTINNAGGASSPFWGSELPGVFATAGRELNGRVVAARVDGVFLSEETTWGLVANRSPKAQSGIWNHMHIVPPSALRFRKPLLSALQATAEKHEEHGMLCRGLAEFPLATVRQAHTLLTTGALYRSEKCIGVAKWLLDLHESLETTKNRKVRGQLIWRAVAMAPAGFCHTRSTMISTLLEDIVAGKAFEHIKRAFDAKMSPILYQRPQAAPTDRQLAAAEAVVSKLSSAGSLARRFARLEEVLPNAIWTPAPVAPPTGNGVFGYLKSKVPAQELSVRTQVITWEKFRRTVLTEAAAVEVLCPQAGSYFAFVTAESQDAPPILQWDREDRRNPVSWYVYHNGSRADAWGLVAGQYCEVSAITLQPSGWTSELAHSGDGAYFILRGARDRNAVRAGLGLFPETLKSEYHGIRAAIEAYSRSKVLGGVEEASACGITLQKGSTQSATAVEVRVRIGGTRVSYRIDRWD